MSEAVGQTLAGRYRVEGLIGQGGMADVYRGVDTMLERPIAIKLLTDRSDTVLRRFLREAQSMARLNHPNIVSVYDAGQDAGLSFIIMELLAGRTLATIPTGELTTHATVRYFIDLLEALAYAHDQGVIHRDMKPANVMVTDDGSVKVMDFGLSRRTSELSSETNAGEIVGTIAYLAPERFLGKVADARSDLYSVGVMMYEIFTGRVPFKSPTDDLVAVIFAHVNEIPTAPRAINRAVPPQIEAIVLKLLEKDADLRFQSARELIAQLASLIGGASPAGASPAARRPAVSTESGATNAQSAASASDIVRSVLDRSFGNTTALQTGFSNTIAGMLAARKRDYAEATRTYTLALAAFSEVKNELEHAKTALKFAAMILQKNSETEKPDRREVEDGIRLLNDALPIIRGNRLLKELDEGERAFFALQRIGLRLR